MDKPVASTKAANSFFKLASFGKRMEFSIISEMLCQGLDVYRPMVDDKGIDAVIGAMMAHTWKYKSKLVLTIQI